MASTMNYARMLAIEVAVKLGGVCREMRAGQRERAVASDQRRRQRWHALDRMLRGSFGAISPAYLFSWFPLIG